MLDSFRNKRLYPALLFFSAINFATHVAVWGTLPSFLPIHWGFSGIDHWVPKLYALLLCDGLPVYLVVYVWSISRFCMTQPGADKPNKSFLFAVVVVLLLASSWIPEAYVWGHGF